MTWLLLTLAGALGALGRFLLGSAVQRVSQAPFPLGTAVVNLLGSLAIGLATGMQGDVRIAVLGFLGGFTTFSTWMVETVELLEEPGHKIVATVNLAGMAAAGCVLAAIGAAIAR